MSARLAAVRWLTIPVLGLLLYVGVSFTEPAPIASAQCITTYYGTTFNCGYYSYYTSMPYYLSTGNYGSGYPYSYGSGYGYPYYGSGSSYAYPYSSYSGYGSGYPYSSGY